MQTLEQLCSQDVPVIFLEKPFGPMRSWDRLEQSQDSAMHVLVLATGRICVGDFGKLACLLCPHT